MSRRYGGSTAASCQLSDAMRTARSDASRWWLTTTTSASAARRRAWNRKQRSKWGHLSRVHRSDSAATASRSEEHTSDSSHLVISYAVFCLKKKKKHNTII